MPRRFRRLGLGHLLARGGSDVQILIQPGWMAYLGPPPCRLTVPSADRRLDVPAPGGAVPDLDLSPRHCMRVTHESIQVWGPDRGRVRAPKADRQAVMRFYSATRDDAVRHIPSKLTDAPTLRLGRGRRKERDDPPSFSSLIFLGQSPAARAP